MDKSLRVKKKYYTVQRMAIYPVLSTQQTTEAL